MRQKGETERGEVRDGEGERQSNREKGKRERLMTQREGDRQTETFKYRILPT